MTKSLEYREVMVYPQNAVPLQNRRPFHVALLSNPGVSGELSDSKLAEAPRFAAASRRDSDGRLVGRRIDASSTFPYRIRPEGRL